jgi:hypothetical protein
LKLLNLIELPPFFYIPDIMDKMTVKENADTLRFEGAGTEDTDAANDLQGRK